MSAVIPDEVKEALSIALVKFIFERYGRGYGASGSVTSAAITGGLVLAADTVLDEAIEIASGVLGQFGLKYSMYDIDIIRDGMIGVLDVLISRFFSYHNIYDDGGITGLAKGGIYTGVVCVVGDYLSKVV